MATSKKQTVWQRGAAYAKTAKPDTAYWIMDGVNRAAEQLEYSLNTAWYRGYMAGAANARAKKRK